MSGLATAVERQVQTTSIFQAQPPFNTPITPLVPAPEPPRIPLQVGSPGQLQQPNPPPLNQPTPAPEPPRIPLQAVPHSSPGYFDAMRPPTAPSNWPQQQNSSIFQAQPFNSPTCTNLPAPSSKLPRIPLQAVPSGYYDAMWLPTAPSNLSQPPNPSIFQAQPPSNSPINQRIRLQAVPPSSPGYFDAMRPPTAPNGRSQQPNPRTPKGVPYGYSVMRF